MAKSTRSKSKRSFRRTKRETGVFAAADAARLERLSSKLAAISRSGELRAVGDDEPQVTEEVGSVEPGQGWSWFELFGLIPPEEIAMEVTDRKGRKGKRKNMALAGWQPTQGSAWRDQVLNMAQVNWEA